MNSITAKLSDWCISVEMADLEGPIRSGADRSIDSVMSRIATTASNPMLREIRRAYLPLAGQKHFGEASSLGGYGKALVLGAAAFLATDDLPIGEQLSCTVVPAALIASSCVETTFAAFVRSVAVGIEVGLRAADALGDAHVSRGWDVVGSAGRVGAVVAAGLALGLTGEGLQNAFGFASTTAAGIHEVGPMLRALGAGKASADAVEAAMLAQQKLIGPPDPISGRRGLFALIAPKGNAELLIEPIGSKWHAVSSAPPGAFSALIGRLSDDDPSAILVEALDAAIAVNVER